VIGRVAIWAWIPDPGQHEYTKDVDVAIAREDERAVRAWFSDRGLRVSELSIGGINYREGEVRLDFIHRACEHGDFSGLFSAAVHAAIARGEMGDVGGGILLPLVPPEYLVAMKILTMEPKDERDAGRLLMRAPLDLDLTREVVRKYLGPLGASRLEVILRQIGHPRAAPNHYGPSGPTAAEVS
jgi:hypothetical protein